MSESESGLEGRRAGLEKWYILVALVALLVWLGLSLTGQALFHNQIERLHAGTMCAPGSGLILVNADTGCAK